jgi:phosphoserine phosphatase
MKKLAAWDLDGTMRPGSLFVDAVVHGGKMGFIDPTRFADVTHPTHDDLVYFVDSLANRSHRDFEGLMTELTEKGRNQIYPWARNRQQEQAADPDMHIVIFSTSPAFLVRAFVSGVDHIHWGRGSHFHTRKLVFSGHAKTLRKLPAVRRYMRENDISTLDFAAGDTMTDVPILQQARHSVVVNPTAELRALAESNAWEIIRTGEMPHA